MIRIEPFKFTLSNAALPTIRDWQAALDAQHFLFRLALIDLRIGQGYSSVHLFDREIEIEIARPTVWSVVEADPSLASGWTQAFAARGTGTLESSVAAVMLMQAIAVATGGVMYDRVGGVYSHYAEQKRGADTLLAAVFGQDALLAARYPDVEPPSQGEGPVEIASRVSYG